MAAKRAAAKAAKAKKKEKGEGSDDDDAMSLSEEEDMEADAFLETQEGVSFTHSGALCSTCGFEGLGWMS